MLKQLKYSVTFPSTGRTFDEAILFQDGFGAVVGPNESGKSMILEMIRFCLFGSAALRGKSDDYKNLKAQLQLTIKGADYIIDRTSTKAQLTKNGEVIAVGVTPVNQKIPTELGFGLAVFDMACAANQNQLLKLGEMKPSERQRAVDSVIGVSVLDDLAKYASDEALALKRAADDLSANLYEPVQPVEPPNYENSGNLEAEKAKLDLLRSEADQLRGWLANPMAEPTEPVRKHSKSVSELQTLIEAQSSARIKRQTLQAELDRIPPAANVTLEEIEEDERAERHNERVQARNKFLTYNRKVEWTQEHLDQLKIDLEDARRYREYEQLKDHLQSLLDEGVHECPCCKHQWPVAGDLVSDIKAKIETLELTGLRRVNLNGLTEEKLDGYQRMLDAWLRVEDEWETVHKDAPDTALPVRWTVQDRVRHRHAIEGRERRAELEAQIEAIVIDTTDHAAHLQLAQQHDAKMQAYHERLDEYQKWLQERDAKLSRLEELSQQLTGYEDLVRRLSEACLYETQMLAYSVAFGRYSDGLLQVAEYRVDAEDWAKVKNALKILRLKIKQHLVPSLNRVASQLITAMTGGQRQSIVVDEEFNISVDGQAIDTLSGSGAAVANLALRIGLGQVLTNNVFSLFMGDEIDASMDKERAEQTSGVFYTLKERISQILLVSHKFPSADYYIAVGENIEQHIDAN